MIPLLHNFPLMAAFLSMVAAQFIKVPLHYMSSKSWNAGLGFSTGGMPSSHSAAVASLATAIGLSSGVASASFAVAVVVSCITMYDAAGIRRHAGLHAAFLNRLMVSYRPPNEEQGHAALKEMLGHRPIEVIVGAILGIAVSSLLYVPYQH